jgi:hypothetical protein
MGVAYHRPGQHRPHRLAEDISALIKTKHATLNYTEQSQISSTFRSRLRLHVAAGNARRAKSGRRRLDRIARPALTPRNSSATIRRLERALRARTNGVAAGGRRWPR